LGIALGSWWAYYELGWGGWWFWDPVENASFMPWLVGTALIHSLAVTEKRGVFKSWTVLLAIFAFSLSLLGTFLVRSGVLTSVHAFASDPARGVFILVLLGLCVGGSLTIYALKAPTVSSAGKFKLLSRESFLLANNALLIVATLTILLGTLYPLIVDFISQEKLSVGSAWFNTMFIPLASALTALAGVGALSRWKVMPGKLLIAQIASSVLLAIFVAAAFPLVYAGEMNFKVAFGLFIATILIATTFSDLWTKSKGQFRRLFKLSKSYWGMVIAHLGVAITVIGITVVSNFSVEKALKMYPGDIATLSGYDFKFAQAGTKQGPNYSAHVGVFEISKNGEEVATLHAEKRRYKVKGSMMTEAAIDPGLFRDLYVSMGEPLEDGAWAMRLQVKAYMRWVWLGAIFMSIGGLLAILDKRYRIRVKNA
jgi:cytochrome c-type biogenesis protein CcmF